MKQPMKSYFISVFQAEVNKPVEAQEMSTSDSGEDSDSEHEVSQIVVNATLLN